jgi:hypothetical protein
MLRSLVGAIVIVFATLSSAAAQLVLFSGAGYVTAATPQCAGEGIFVASFMLGSYLPAGLGSNGPESQLTHASLPQATKPHAVALRTEGLFPDNFKRVNGTAITPLELKTFKPRARVKSKPAVFSGATTNVEYTITVTDTMGVDGCDFTLNLSTVRRPG